ncbi:MAG: alcohol dehydrogenase catalytic domain-containing protein [Pseudomonadota bacterium]
MQVGLVTGQGEISLVDMPYPQPEIGKAVVEISYCGICGTDLHAYQSGQPYNPAICGHEWVGHVSALGPEVSNCKEGDRVAIGVASACGRCPTCQRGDAAHCESAFAGAIGMGPMAAPHGGFAEAISFDASRLYLVPGALTDEQAGLLEPATVAVHALRRTPINLGDSVVVLGAGPIGLLVLQAARLSGAGQIILVEPEPARRKLGEQMGADYCIDPTDGSVLERVGDYLSTHGSAGITNPDIVFECAGIPATIQQSVELVRRGGVVSLVGVANHPASIDPGLWMVKEVRLVSSIAYQHEDFEICKYLAADGRLDLASLHTSTVTLNNLNEAFATLSHQPSEVKILVDPRENHSS